MSIAVKAIEPRLIEDEITAFLVDGRTISVPIAWSWRLSEATSEQRQKTPAPGKLCGKGGYQHERQEIGHGRGWHVVMLPGGDGLTMTVIEPVNAQVPLFASFGTAC